MIQAINLEIEQTEEIRELEDRLDESTELEKKNENRMKANEQSPKKPPNRTAEKFGGTEVLKGFKNVKRVWSLFKEILIRTPKPKNDRYSDIGSQKAKLRFNTTKSILRHSQLLNEAARESTVRFSW